MKIISSVIAAATTASPAPVENVTLSVIPALNAPEVSGEDLTKIKDQLLSLQAELKRAGQQGQEEFARQIAQIKQEWQAQMGSLTENSKKTIARLEERLGALEQFPRFTEDRMLEQIKESVKKEFDAVRVPPPAPAPLTAPALPPPDAWDSDLKRKEKTLQDLKAELSKIPAVPLSAPVSVPAQSAPAPDSAVAVAEPAPLAVEGLKKRMAQENAYETSGQTNSIFTKLWLYLNESAIEIPLKNSKNNS